jgi:CheY-like chemotaxis protein
LAKKPFNLEWTLEKVLSINHFQLKEKEQSVLIEMDEDIPNTLIGDDQRLTQVLSNLVSNAIKCSPEKKEIRIVVGVISQDSSNCTLKFDVIDQGFGISSDKHSKIFEPFFQIENPVAHEYTGTGLGLHICKRITELMDGRIWVESTLGEGSIFSFTANVALPQKTESAVANGFANQEKAVHKLDLSGKNILLVEDVETNRKVFMMHLESTGVTIEWAEHGAAALEKFTKESAEYDLIFMDVLMPVMDGLESTRRIRELKLPGAKEVPIIAMTANVFQDDIDKCFAAGMNAHLAKPFDTEALMDIIQQNLAKN